MNKIVLLVFVIMTITLAGCVPGGGYTGDLSDPYRFHKIGTVVDKLEDDRGKKYVIEVVDKGDLIRGEVSKTEYERSVVGQQVYYKPQSFISPVEIVVPNLEGMRLR